MTNWRKLLFMAALMAGIAAPASAQTRETPYWASIRATELNLRVGPSADYPIAWVYRRQGLPMKVVKVKDGWRLVEDPDGDTGWVVARLLDPERTAIVTDGPAAALRSEPQDSAPLRWQLEAGVVGELGACENGWCRLDVNGRKGWIRAERLWGAEELGTP